jgi:sugar transferase (PEP-CTERM/EpsH1 system associated)
VASIVRSRQEAEAGQGLADHCSKFLMETVGWPMAAGSMLARLPTSTPFSMGYFYSRRLYQRIQSELDKDAYDFIMVHCSSVAQYVENVSGIPKLLDFGDMDSQKWLIYGQVRKFPLKIIFSMEGSRLLSAEQELARKFDMCTCTTRAEKDTLASYGSGATTDWFPNGVDTAYFKPAKKPYEPDTICFLGRMDYFPNQECMFDFSKNIFPAIKAKRPDARLFIIGADPPPAVKSLENQPGVTVTGTVDDVRPYVHRCAVNVAPLNISRGTQNKVLESLAMGVPSVISADAARGVDIVPGEHALVAENHRGFVDAVVRLLSDPQERKKFSEAGRARMLSHHTWKGSMLKLDGIIETCLKISKR